jgi:hypothetical protein
LAAIDWNFLGCTYARRRPWAILDQAASSGPWPLGLGRDDRCISLVYAQIGLVRLAAGGLCIVHEGGEEWVDVSGMTGEEQQHLRARIEGIRDTAVAGLVRSAAQDADSHRAVSRMRNAGEPVGRG